MIDDLSKLPLVLKTEVVAELDDTTPDQMWKLVREGQSAGRAAQVGQGIEAADRLLVLASLGIIERDGADPDEVGADNE